MLCSVRLGGDLFGGFGYGDFGAGSGEGEVEDGG